MSSLSALRRKARHYAVQALYQWQLAGASPSDIEAEFLADNDMTHVDVEYFHEAVSSIPSQIEQLDALFEPSMDRTVKELDPVSLSVLRLATWEFQQRVDVPYKVVINEAVALAKKFGPEDSHKFVNGVLDKLAPQLREAETSAQ